MSNSIETVRSHNSVVGRIVGCAAIFLFVGCDATPTRDTTIPDSFREQWAIGQERLQPYVGARAYLVYPEQFTFEKRDEPFQCGDIDGAWGCFWAPQGRIEWFDVRVLAHESQHAILWKLGDSRWRCVEHEPDCIGREP